MNLAAVSLSERFQLWFSEGQELVQQLLEIFLEHHRRSGWLADLAETPGRASAYALVQAELERAGIVGVNMVAPGLWRVLTESEPEYGPMRETLVEAVDASKESA